MESVGTSGRVRRNDSPAERAQYRQRAVDRIEGTISKQVRNQSEVLQPRLDFEAEGSTDDVYFTSRQREHDWRGGSSVRHCDSSSGNDPYARLKRALKADIDEEARGRPVLHRERPFPRRETGKIAVKVINEHGDEVLQDFEK